MDIDSEQTAKRGRGRPRRGESAWDTYISTAARNRNWAMVYFGYSAKQRGFTMLAFARKLGVDLRGFQRYFESGTPRDRTASLIATTLGYTELAALALTNRITPTHARRELSEVMQRLDREGTAIFGNRVEDARNAVVRAFRADWRLLTICSILGRCGLNLNDASRILGRHFSELEKGVRDSTGSTLWGFVPKDPAHFIRANRDKLARFRAALDDLALAPPDNNAIWRLVGVSVNEPLLFTEDMPDAQVEAFYNFHRGREMKQARSRLVRRR